MAEKGHHSKQHQNMAGMASPSELKELEESESTSFDKLFLKLMINHHDGALEMVKTLKNFLEIPMIRTLMSLYQS